MFTTIYEVKELTGQDVTAESIAMAQAVIEAYVGRLEPEVTNARDLVLLARATAWQAVYMVDNLDLVFFQVDVVQQQGPSGMVTYKNNLASPWISTLAILACQGLSWKRMRAIKTTPLFSQKDYSEYRWDRA